MAADLTIRRLAYDELGRVAEIDRTERIDLIYVQRGAELEGRPGDWSSPGWDLDGDGDHSVATHTRDLEHYVDAGGVALGGFDGDRMVGIGAVVPHIRPGIAQLGWLHVISATPSEHTVTFYRRRGYEVMAEPLPELYEREPDDIHLEKRLQVPPPPASR